MSVSHYGDYLVWGLDIGIGSCGWAVLDLKNNRIVDMGVRLWDVPQEPKTKTSLAATRRNARSVRRNNKRTADRKKHCLKLLQKEGLVPSAETAKWLQTTKGEPQTILLRAKGLDKKLSPRAWAQVLYSLCGRRGYIPHGEGDFDAEGKAVLKAIAGNTEAMANEGYRTVGEMLAAKGKSRNRAGDYSLCVSNQQLVDEVKALFSAQASFGNEHASDSFLDEYLDIMLWQKDVSEQDKRIYDQVGYCTYFTEERLKRAAKCTLSFEMCDAYERVCNIRIMHFDGTEEALASEMRNQIIRTLFSPVPLPGNKKCKVSYADLRKLLDLKSTSLFKGIPTEDEKKKLIYDPKSWAKIRETLPEDLTLKLRENRALADAVGEALAYSSSKESLIKQLNAIAELEAPDIEAICKLPYAGKIFNGYGNRSLKALTMLLDAFEDSEAVDTLAKAEEATGLKDKRLNSRRTLGTRLPPYSVFDPTNKNPVVLRVMGQVRKVVNALYKEYGAPDRINIELARELKHSQHEKKLIYKRNNERKSSRDVARAKLAEDLEITPEEVKGKLLRKYQFDVEQNEMCPYCGKAIDYTELISDDHAFEIDHILPYSRTCDDSQNNKVLVHPSCNQDKGQRTPYEWITQEGRSWEDFKIRIMNLNKLPFRKREHLLNTDLSDEKSNEFIKRNLNDTRYASRETLAFIEEFLKFRDNGEKQHVFAVSGGATAILRNAWGIAKIREEDDCHHAVDAAVIAACSRGMVSKIARVSEQKHLMPKEERKKLFEDTAPWDSFVDELAYRKERIIPTRKVEHGVTGRAFEDFLYHYAGLNEKETKGMLVRSGKTKPNSNFVVGRDNTAKIVDGMAFLRLWWDMSYCVGKRKEHPGRLLLEPVYYADIPAIRDGSYVPKSIPLQSEKRDRRRWSPISNDILATKPIYLFFNDAIELNGGVFRFGGVNIDSCSWKLIDPRNAKIERTKGHSALDIMTTDSFKVIQEDVLGRCFWPYLSNSEE